MHSSDREARHAAGPPGRALTLGEVFPPEAVLLPLDERSRAAVVAAMVGRLVQIGRLPARHEHELAQAILARENAASTALWPGMALPNIRTALTDRFVGVLAVDPRGVDFAAAGGDPVKVIFLLVAPHEPCAEGIDLLGRIAAVGQNKSLLVRLAGCRNAAEVLQVLQDIDRT